MVRKFHEPRLIVALCNYIFREMMHETVIDEVKIHTKLLFHSAIMNYKAIERIKKYKKVEE